MNIRFLGTSACWPLPRLGCHCPICTSSDPRDKRTRSSILINNQTLIDCGPDFYHQILPLLQTTSYQLQSIIITHSHYDHIFGLFDASKIYGGKKIKLYAVKSTLQVIQDLLGMNLANFEVHQVKENLPFMVDNLKVTLFPVQHGTTPTYGVKIKADRLLGYVPDFNRILPSLQKLLKDMNMLILDGSSLNSVGKAHGHITIEEGIKLAKQLKAKKIFFTHLGHKTKRYKDLKAFVEENGGFNFHIAYDGLEIYSNK